MVFLNPKEQTKPVAKSIENLIPNLGKGTFIEQMQNSSPHEKCAKTVRNILTPEFAAKAVKRLKKAALIAGLSSHHKQLTGSEIMLTNSEIK